MTLWYNFTGDESEDFEYDLSYTEIEKYLMNLPNEELVDAFKQSFESLPKTEQIRLLAERGERNFACPDFLKWIEDDKYWVVTEFIMDNEILELFEDELHDEFEEKAYEKYQDEQSFKKDPYAYNGLNRADFD